MDDRTPDQLLAQLRAEPNQPGVLKNVIDSMLAMPEVDESVKVILRRMRSSIRDTDTAYSLSLKTNSLVTYLMEMTGAPLRRSLRGPAQHLDYGGRRRSTRGGAFNVFQQWREDYLPVRQHPLDGPAVQNTILIGLHTLLDKATTARERGERVSPIERVVADTYDEVIAPVSGNAGRTPGDVLRMLAVLDDRLSTLSPPPAPATTAGGARRSQTKRFGSCVKAVRKTVKARKGSTAEGAAIAICTKTLLHPRGRTIRRYRKGRLLTQTRK